MLPSFIRTAVKYYAILNLKYDEKALSFDRRIFIRLSLDAMRGLGVGLVDVSSRFNLYKQRLAVPSGSRASQSDRTMKATA